MSIPKVTPVIHWLLHQWSLATAEAEEALEAKDIVTAVNSRRKANTYANKICLRLARQEASTTERLAMSWIKNNLQHKPSTKPKRIMPAPRRKSRPAQ